MVETSFSQSFATMSMHESRFDVSAYIFIVYENGNHENIPLEPWNISTQKSVEAMHSNQKIMTRALSEMSSKGYHLISSSMSSTETHQLTQFIFQKRE